jgi:Arc/MetJ family transcription regulator
MARNVSIDSDLLDEAFKVSGEPTKTAAVTKALREFVAHRRQRGLLDLVGKFEWDPAYDHKVERTSRADRKSAKAKAG